MTRLRFATALEILEEDRPIARCALKTERCPCVATNQTLEIDQFRDCAPKFDPVEPSVYATLVGVEALRFEISERGLVAHA